jgi:serine/threonine-protein kinase RsbW
MDADSGHLRLPARLESLDAFREHALAAATRAGLTPPAAGRLELVLEEVLVNIVRYAYGGATDGMDLIELSYMVEGPGHLRLEVRDWAPAFDPLAPEDAGLEERLDANLEADLDDRLPGGLGLLLLRTLSDAQYRREAGANVLTLRFGDETAGA